MTAEKIAENGLYGTMQVSSIIPERATEKLTATRMSAEEALLGYRIKSQMCAKVFKIRIIKDVFFSLDLPLNSFK